MADLFIPADWDSFITFIEYSSGSEWPHADEPEVRAVSEELRNAGALLVEKASGLNGLAVNVFNGMRGDAANAFYDSAGSVTDWVPQMVEHLNSMAKQAYDFAGETETAKFEALIGLIEIYLALITALLSVYGVSLVPYFLNYGIWFSRLHKAYLKIKLFSLLSNGGRFTRGTVRTGISAVDEAIEEARNGLLAQLLADRDGIDGQSLAVGAGAGAFAAALAEFWQKILQRISPRLTRSPLGQAGVDILSEGPVEATLAAIFHQSFNGDLLAASALISTVAERFGQDAADALRRKLGLPEAGTHRNPDGGGSHFDTNLLSTPSNSPSNPSRGPSNSPSNPSGGTSRSSSNPSRGTSGSPSNPSRGTPEPLSNASRGTSGSPSRGASPSSSTPNGSTEAPSENSSTPAVPLSPNVLVSQPAPTSPNAVPSSGGTRPVSPEAAGPAPGAPVGSHPSVGTGENAPENQQHTPPPPAADGNTPAAPPVTTIPTGDVPSGDTPPTVVTPEAPDPVAPPGLMVTPPAPATTVPDPGNSVITPPDPVSAVPGPANPVVSSPATANPAASTTNPAVPASHHPASAANPPVAPSTPSASATNPVMAASTSLATSTSLASAGDVSVVVTGDAATTISGDPIISVDVGHSGDAAGGGPARSSLSGEAPFPGFGPAASSVAAPNATPPRVAPPGGEARAVPASIREPQAVPASVGESRAVEVSAGQSRAVEVPAGAVRAVDAPGPGGDFSPHATTESERATATPADAPGGGTATDGDNGRDTERDEGVATGVRPERGAGVTDAGERGARQGGTRPRTRRQLVSAEIGTPGVTGGTDLTGTRIAYHAAMGIAVELASGRFTRLSDGDVRPETSGGPVVGRWTPEFVDEVPLVLSEGETDPLGRTRTRVERLFQQVEKRFREHAERVADLPADRRALSLSEAFPAAEGWTVEPRRRDWVYRPARFSGKVGFQAQHSAGVPVAGLYDLMTAALRITAADTATRERHRHGSRRRAILRDALTFGAVQADVLAREAARDGAALTPYAMMSLKGFLALTYVGSAAGLRGPLGEIGAEAHAAVLARHDLAAVRAALPEPVRDLLERRSGTLIEQAGALMGRRWPDLTEGEPVLDRETEAGPPVRESLRGALTGGVTVLAGLEQTRGPDDPPRVVVSLLTGTPGAASSAAVARRAEMIDAVVERIAARTGELARATSRPVAVDFGEGRGEIGRAQARALDRYADDVVAEVLTRPGVRVRIEAGGNGRWTEPGNGLHGARRRAHALRRDLAVRLRERFVAVGDDELALVADRYLGDDAIAVVAQAGSRRDAMVDQLTRVLLAEPVTRAAYDRSAATGVAASDVVGRRRAYVWTERVTPGTDRPAHRDRRLETAVRFARAAAARPADPGRGPDGDGRTDGWWDVGGRTGRPLDACVPMVNGLATALYPGGLRPARPRDDAEIGLGGVPGVRQLLAGGPDWRRVTDPVDLERQVRAAGPGATVLVLAQRPGGEPGHALALHHGPDGVRWVDMPAGALQPGRRPVVVDIAARLDAVIIGADGTTRPPDQTGTGAGDTVDALTDPSAGGGYGRAGGEYEVYSAEVAPARRGRPVEITKRRLAHHPGQGVEIVGDTGRFARRDDDIVMAVDGPPPYTPRPIIEIVDREPLAVLPGERDPLGRTPESHLAFLRTLERRMNGLHQQVADLSRPHRGIAFTDAFPPGEGWVVEDRARDLRYRPVRGAAAMRFNAQYSAGVPISGLYDLIAVAAQRLGPDQVFGESSGGTVWKRTIAQDALAFADARTTALSGSLSPHEAAELRGFLALTYVQVAANLRGPFGGTIIKNQAAVLSRHDLTVVRAALPAGARALLGEHGPRLVEQAGAHMARRWPRLVEFAAQRRLPGSIPVTDILDLRSGDVASAREFLTSALTGTGRTVTQKEIYGTGTRTLDRLDDSRGDGELPLAVVELRLDPPSTQTVDEVAADFRSLIADVRRITERADTVARRAAPELPVDFGERERRLPAGQRAAVRRYAVRPLPPVSTRIRTPGRSSRAQIGRAHV